MTGNACLIFSKNRLFFRCEIDPVCFIALVSVVVETLSGHIAASNLYIKGVHREREAALRYVRATDEINALEIKIPWDSSSVLLPMQTLPICMSPLVKIDSNINTV